jgi:hypothetical protein
MQITFISSLTPEDEGRLAVALLDAVGGLLDLLPIAYSVRVETSSGGRLDRTHSPRDSSAAPALEPAGDVVVAALRVVGRERHGPPTALSGARPRP